MYLSSYSVWSFWFTTTCVVKLKCNPKFVIAELWLLVKVGVFRWKNVACCMEVWCVGTGLLVDLCKHGCGLFRPVWTGVGV